MMLEAKRTILLGLGLVAYGLAALAVETETFKKWRAEFNASINLDHARWRRHEMVDEEMNVPDPEPDERVPDSA